MIIPSGFCQITHNFGGNGLAFPGAVVYGVDQGGGATVEDVAENAHNAWVGTILTQQTDDITLESTIAKFGPNSTGPSAEFSDPQDGSIGGLGSPSNCAYLIRKNSSLGGRRGRGRMYVPGVAESTTGSDGAIDPGTASIIQDSIDDFVAALVLLSLPMVILHSDATTPTPVTTLRLQANIATQRRRLRR